MAPLPIVWQRLVDRRGQTCDRCSATFEGLQQAVAQLEEVLRPIGVEPTLETRDIDKESFAADPSQSNRVWIAGKPIEEWLDAHVATSRCCSVCGDAECRTIAVANHVFEAIPSELILKAGLIAAAQLVGPNPQASGKGELAGCCPK